MTCIRAILYLGLGVGSILTGCIDEPSTERDRQEEGSGGGLSISNGEAGTERAGEEGDDVGGEPSDRDTSGSDSAGDDMDTTSGDDQSDRSGSEAGDELGGVMSGGGVAGEEAGESLGGEDTPIDADRGPGCQAYCDQLTECFIPECPGSELFFNDEVCDQWCGGGAGRPIGCVRRARV